MAAREPARLPWEAVEEKSFPNIRGIQCLSRMVFDGVVSTVWSGRTNIVAVSQDHRGLFSFDTAPISLRPYSEQNINAISALLSGESPDSGSLPTGALASRFESRVVTVCSLRSNYRCLICVTEDGKASCWVWYSAESRWIFAGAAHVSDGVTLTNAAVLRIFGSNPFILWENRQNHSLCLSSISLSSSDAASTAAPSFSFSLGEAQIIETDIEPVDHIISVGAGAWILTASYLYFFDAEANSAETQLISIDAPFLSAAQAAAIPWSSELSIVGNGEMRIISRIKDADQAALQVRSKTPCDLATPIVQGFATYAILADGSRVDIFDASRSVTETSYFSGGPVSFSNHLFPEEGDFLLALRREKGIYRVRVTSMIDKTRLSSRPEPPLMEKLDLPSRGRSALERFEQVSQSNNMDLGHDRELLDSFHALSSQLQNPALPAAMCLSSDLSKSPTLAALRSAIADYLSNMDAGHRKRGRKGSDSPQVPDGDSFTSAAPVSLLDERSQEHIPDSLSGNLLQMSSQLNLALVSPMHDLLRALSTSYDPSPRHENTTDIISKMSFSDLQALTLSQPERSLEALEKALGIDRRLLERLAAEQRSSRSKSIVLPLPDLAQSFPVAPSLYSQTPEQEPTRPLFFETICELYSNLCPQLLTTFVDIVQLTSADASTLEPTSSSSTDTGNRRTLSILLSNTKPLEVTGSQNSSSTFSNSMKDMAAVLDAAGHLEPAPYSPPKASFYHRALNTLVSCGVHEFPASEDQFVAFLTLLDRTAQTARVLRHLISRSDNSKDPKWWDQVLAYVESKAGDDPPTQPVYAELMTIILHHSFNYFVSTGNTDRLVKGLEMLPSKVSAADFMNLFKSLPSEPGRRIPTLPISSIRPVLLKLLGNQ